MAGTSKNTRETPSVVRIRPETRAKLGQVAAARRWTLVETMAAITDHYIAAHGINTKSKRA